MAEAKTKATAASPLAFIGLIPDEERRTDCLKLVELMTKATGAEAVMWGGAIVGFGKYRYKYADGHESDWPVIAFSPRKNDLTLYIMPDFAKKAELLAKLGKHKTTKACLYVKRLSDVDGKVLKQIIVESVKAMKSQRVDL